MVDQISRRDIHAKDILDALPVRLTPVSELPGFHHAFGIGAGRGSVGHLQSLLRLEAP